MLSDPEVIVAGERPLLRADITFVSVGSSPSFEDVGIVFAPLNAETARG